MNKNWEVTLIYSVTVAVENAEDSDSAVEFALDTVSSYMDSKYRSDGIVREVTDTSEWESIERHADFVSVDESDEG